ncbi:glycoside hydrolase family 172 protein [Gracilibacillus phocaeensis]|uniref:glycoside hydrolase family 172 protein n=1 Tax=Gracilibacillus phocaeensis TaxID=2042304 RepID=UPI0010306260|nr:glycoside hydrolase family 172 protein [Gracilibacillus phocaeensis]
MFQDIFTNNLASLALTNNGKSRAITAENPTGEPGQGGKASNHLGSSRKGSPCLKDINPGETVTLCEIKGPGVIQHIWMTVTEQTEGNYFVLRDLVLRMYWDDQEHPSVETPLGDFFCNGFGRGCTVNSIPIAVNPTRGFNSYFPMPFLEKAVITVENQHEAPIPALFYQIDYCLYDSLPENTAYFHAKWNRQKITNIAEDYVIIDEIKGKGQYVGTYIGLATLERYWWGEGEVKFYMDGDKDYPTICGTGMEDYFGGAWSFATQEYGKTVENTYCTPYMGYPYYSKSDDAVHFPFHNDDVPPMRGFYRWHIPDPIRFEEELKVTIQQIGVYKNGLFERQDDLCSVAYWYQTIPHQPFPPLPSVQERWPR